MKPAGQFLATARRAVLFCRDGSGRPIGYPMSIVAHRDGCLLFTTYAKSAKVVHLRADPTAACVVLSDEPLPRAWLSATGSVVVERPTESEINRLFADRQQDRRVPERVTASVRQRLRDGKRVMLRFRPDAPDQLVVESDDGADRG